VQYRLIPSPLVAEAARIIFLLFSLDINIRLRFLYGVCKQLLTVQLHLRRANVLHGYSWLLPLFLIVNSKGVYLIIIQSALYSKRIKKVFALAWRTPTLSYRFND
jgi:hypothetical protein